MTNANQLTDFLQAKLAEQPWYRTYANTVTTLATLGVNVVWILTSLGIDLPTNVTVGVAAAIQALGVLGVKLTPNGVTQRQIEEIDAYVGRHRADG